MSKRKSIAHDYDREQDGVEYIAISCRARTRLGRALAAGGHLPSEHRDYGRFNSIAGLIRYLGGDHREINRDISGVEYDDAYTDQLGSQYEEVLQVYLKRALNTLAFLKSDLRMAIADKLPFYLYHVVDNEWVNVPMPEWLDELIKDMLKSMGDQDQAESAQAMQVQTSLHVEDPNAQEIDLSIEKQGDGSVRIKNATLSGVMGKSLDWDANEIHPPTTQRSLLQLQAAYIEATQGTDAAIDFVVSQAEYDSLPENVRTMMGETLKIQRAIEGTAVPAPKKE